MCGLIRLGCSRGFYKEFAAFRNDQRRFSAINGLKRS